MLKIFDLLADTIVYKLFGMTPKAHLTEALHFFILDVSKIFVLILIMIYVITFLQTFVNAAVLRKMLNGKVRIAGYFGAALLGAVTPFCSCSSIPLFLSLIKAKIPIGIAMSFLIVSPIINEAMIGICGPIFGWHFLLLYITSGIAVGMLGGMFFDLIKADRFLLRVDHDQKNAPAGDSAETAPKSFKERHQYSLEEVKWIIGKIWLYIIIGVGLGAAMHGYLPKDFIASATGNGAWWNVPAAVLLGIPLYTNATGSIPVIQALVAKGLPIGTALAFMMSSVGASFPEFTILKRVMSVKLLIIFFIYLLLAFSFCGYIFNQFSFLLKQ